MDTPFQTYERRPKTLEPNILSSCLRPVRFIWEPAPERHYEAKTYIIVDRRNNPDFFSLYGTCDRNPIEHKVEGFTHGDAIAYVHTYICEHIGRSVDRYILEIDGPLKIAEAPLRDWSTLKWTGAALGLGAAAYGGYRGIRYVMSLRNRLNLLQDKLYILDGALSRVKLLLNQKKAVKKDIEEMQLQLRQVRLDSDEMLAKFQLPSSD
uniref:Uncharacterized protein n=1 Tax=viral metagenome TaxID=1070528 RepID=A0A6C0BRB0_9ZZZZ